MRETYIGLLILVLVVGGLGIALGLYALYQKNKETKLDKT